MSKDKKDEVAEKSVGERLDEISATIGALAATMKRNTENWKRHMIKYHDSNGDGTVGGASILALAIVAGCLLVGSFAFADRIIDQKVDRDNTVIYQLTTDDAGLGNLTITGTLTANATTEVVNASSTNLAVDGTLTASGATTLGDVLTVAGNSEFTGTVAIVGASTLTGALNANGGALFDTDRVEIADTTGNTVIRGSLSANTIAATGAVTAASTLVVQGASTFKTVNIGALAAQTNATVGGTLAVTGVGTFTARSEHLAGAGITTNGYFTVAKQNGSNALVYISGTFTNIIDATIAE